ncbi:tryptophan--tRNA ligase [Paenibacillus alkalitolerans]|uniref:tryptophan--tRNA ligase n=1 Tax=Paenibacillus alkalitolerans TaxID=2799335 RepID=UPI0018F3BC85|nr:tryptophan--tRNA ligase [Paenibacillus alkalitolerans]
MKKVLSGIQPSGLLTIGNYIGAIRQFVEMQDTHDCYFMIVDLHAITVPQEPEKLREQTESVAAMYLASGIDPEKAVVFLQSQVRAHAVLGWIMTTLTGMGELERMTQFKDKSAGKESVGAGLFVYPSLQAADIVLYNADLVPVGEDQKQHLELTRDLAQRFNHRYGDTFVVPEPHITDVGKRIMSLIDASKKMSKSDPNPGAFISMFDEPDVIRKKFSRATTDSGREIKYDPDNKPEVSNLLEIFSIFSKVPISDLEARYEGQGYGALKKDIAEAVISVLEPIQARYRDIRQSGELQAILKRGAEKANAVADATLKRAMERMGFLL